MGNFYDQDNPRAHLANREVNNSIQPVKDNVIYDDHNRDIVRREASNTNMAEAYLKRAEITKKKSTMTSTQNARIKVIQQQRKRQEMNQRLAALGLSCLAVGGIATSIISSVVNKFEEQAAIYSQISEFRRDVIEPNTHRTNNGNAFFYDYDDIAEAIFESGKDPSVELFKAYETLGRNYTDDLLDEANYPSLENYVRRCGFDNIRDWENYSNEAVLVQAQIAEKQAELNAMHDEYVSNTNSSAMLSAQLNGGNK